jgi:hypothetical protein
MLRGIIAAAATTSLLLAATSASAQDAGGGFATKGQFIISADRLVPLFSYTNNKITDNTVNPSQSYSTTSTTISLLPNLQGIGLAAGQNQAVVTGSFYNTPRVGFDYAVIDHLTIGGSIAFATTLGASETVSRGAGSQSNDVAKGTYFAIAPRIGYAIPLTDQFTFWPRGGLSFNLAHVSYPDETQGNITVQHTANLSLWALSLEPMFVFTPVNHFGFYAGPVLDIPLTGSASDHRTNTPGPNQTLDTSVDFSEFHFGITAGLLGYL